jgi:hypothetical protein
MQVSDGRGQSFMREQTFLFTPVLDTSAYSSGDVLFAPVEIRNFFPNGGEARALHSIQILDEDAQAAAFDLVLFTSQQSIGAVNSAVSITDTIARSICGVQRFAATDWMDWVAWDIIELGSIGKILRGETTSLWVAGVARGTPTHTASGLKIVLGAI